jgi:teichuronic acid biosynthesis glycosyltransferase TuaH
MILKDKVIFILGIAKFDGPFESTSFTVAKYLAKENEVYYVDYPYTWKDYLMRRDDLFQKRKHLFSRKSDGILDSDIAGLKIVIVPPVLSINFLKEGKLYRFLLKINERTIAHRITKAIGASRIKEAVYINSFNFHYPNLQTLLKPKLSVYHCVDPLIVDHDRKHGLISERIVVEQSDLVICTSKQLYQEKKPLNKATFFIPNAADSIHSAKAMDPGLMMHVKMQAIPKPILGYFGNIERRIDYDLLMQVVRLNSDKSFVFAGPAVEEFIPQGLREMKNVYFLGRIPYEEMPAVIKAFDVALIPFKKDEVSSTIFPLKLFEYLGAGKAVVSTDFNLDLREFTHDEIEYCADVKTFDQAIQRALDDDKLSSRMRRVAIAAENSWDKRLLEFSNLLNDYYSDK